ncbi:MAG: hypothetical protein PVG65_01130 [Candidatus Thorarchaeota archaeon]|jgi:hypothetical protein
MEAQTQIEELLDEFKIHRNEIKQMISELSKIKDRVDTLIPTKVDGRYVRLFEEKVKAMTNLFGTLLEMRKEISKSLKDEIDLRRKAEVKGDLGDIIEDELDFGAIAEKIESFKESRQKLKEKFDKEIEDEPAIEEIDIPGVNTGLIE